MQRLSKSETAKCQLVTAIRLFFDDSDPVSIFTLAANAWEIVDVLCCKNGIDSLSNQSRKHIPGGKDLKYDFVNSPFRSFFKHADRDPDACLEGFDDQKCDSMIFLGVEDYMRLHKKSPLEFQVFQLWYLAVHIEKVADDALNGILDSIETYFPNIRALTRVEQKRMGKLALLDTRQDAALAGDPGVEPSL
jgi:hypothetical protein